MKEEIYQRTKILLGTNMNKIKSMHVCICGIGGVGSYTLEALARIGIGKVTIVDRDEVDITNINRQIIALNSTVGKEKVTVAKERINDINPDIDVIAIKLNVDANNIDSIITKDIDYVVDAVDNVDAKIAIIQKCNKENIKCISCMGMGNKLNPLDIRVDDIYKTSVCPLAKVVRKKLKYLCIKSQKVVYSIETSIEKNKEEKKEYGNTLGSVSFVPSVAGLVIASEVIKDSIK
ncbi:MAG: tRNA threonylcarbamoyladenosine dehydratase [Clostridia bacterium]